jgi:hypothetical protein
MATLDQFKSNLLGGGARANQFKVTLVAPAGVPAVNNAEFFVSGASLPGQTITEVPINYRGRILHVNGDREFEPWTITVINDTDFAIRNMIETWMNKIQDISTNNAAANFSEYVADLTVTQLGRQNDNVLKTHVLKNCWPTAMDAIELNWDTVSEVERFTVTWRYTDFTGTAGSAGA